MVTGDWQKPPGHQLVTIELGMKRWGWHGPRWPRWPNPCISSDLYPWTFWGTRWEMAQRMTTVHVLHDVTVLSLHASTTFDMSLEMWSKFASFLPNTWLWCASRPSMFDNVQGSTKPQPSVRRSPSPWYSSNRGSQLETISRNRWQAVASMPNLSTRTTEIRRYWKIRRFWKTRQHMQNAISFLQLSTCCWCCPARLQPKDKTYETRVERSWSNVEAMLRVQECIHPVWLPQIRLVSLRFVDELCAVPNHRLHAWPHCENLSLDVSFVCYYVVFRCFVLIESSLSRGDSSET